MKKSLFVIFLFLILPVMVYADDSFSINCDQDNLNVNEEFTCRVAVNSTANYNQVSFNLNLPDGISLEDVRSNYTKLWDVKNANNNITATIKDNQVETGLQEFGILLLSTNKSGLKTININGIKLEDTTKNNSLTLSDINSNIKIISNNTNLKDLKINNVSISNFNKNSNIININTNETKIKVEGLAEDEFATVTGNGDYTFDQKNNELIIPITIKSENNDYKIVLVDLKHNALAINNIDKTLSEVIIKDNNNNNILLDFKPKIYNYDVEVSTNTTSLTVTPKLNNDQASFIKNYGIQTINLNNGDNVILIKVADKEGQTLTYIINVTKPLSNKSANGYIKSLLIHGYKMSFNKRVKKYTLEVKNNTKSLKITPLLESDTASYTIEGNKDLKDGSTIKIIVTAENESKTIYQITVNYRPFNYALLVVYILIGLGIGYGFYHKLKGKKKVIIKKAEPVVITPKPQTVTPALPKKNVDKVKTKVSIKGNKPPIKKSTVSSNNNSYKPKQYTKKQKGNRKKNKKTNYKRK